MRLGLLYVVPRTYYEFRCCIRFVRFVCPFIKTPARNSTASLAGHPYQMHPHVQTKTNWLTSNRGSRWPEGKSLCISCAPTFYLNPRGKQINSPKPNITAIKAIILHTFGVQVGLQDSAGRP